MTNNNMMSLMETILSNAIGYLYCVDVYLIETYEVF